MALVTVVTLVVTRAWKNVNFLGSLSRFPVSCKCKTIISLWCYKRISFLENLHLRANQLTLINLDSHWVCKQLHRWSVLCYHSYIKIRSWLSANTVEAANLCLEVANSHTKCLLVEIRKHLTSKLQILTGNTVCFVWTI